jgi:hypothetical protein
VNRRPSCSLPAVQGQQLAIGQNLDFSAGVSPEGTLSVTWRRGGAIVGTVREYVYTASQVGRDTLRVHAEAGESVRDYFWVIDVAPEPRTEPPAVPSFALFPGDDPVEVSLSWTRVSVSTYPIVEYVVAVSYTGVVTTANWGPGHHPRHHRPCAWAGGLQCQLRQGQRRAGAGRRGLVRHSRAR